MTLKIEPTGEQQQRFIEVAESLGVLPEQLAHAAILDVVQGPSPELVKIAERLLRKNAELYKRLAQ